MVVKDLDDIWSEGYDWFTDIKAYRYLKARGWHYDKGIWQSPSPTYPISREEWSAVQYLVMEWDEGFEPWPMTGKEASSL